VSITRIGPVPIDGTSEHGKPTFSWTSSPTAKGVRGASMGGLLTWRQVDQLDELVNRSGAITVDGHEGIPVYIHYDGTKFSPRSGWYLLTGISADPTQPSTLSDYTAPFSLGLAYLGDHRQAVVERSARAKPATFAITPKALVAAPWWSEEPEGEVFTLNPGGVRFTRPYDPTSPFDLLRTAPADGVRDLTIYAGNVTASTDSMKSVVIPNLRTGTDFDGQTTPRWLTDRGGDVVAWDRSRGVEVMSEAHSFASTTDIAIGNGMLRFWVGSRGLPPYLTVEALYPSAWTQVGHLLLGGPGVLRGARLVKLTPDEARLVLTIQGGGDITVTLKRPDRMVRIGWDTRPPAGAPDRAVAWSGTPPTSRRVAAVGAAGKFGQGLDVPAGGATDLFLRWPANTPKTAWTKVLWWRPTAAASGAAAGIQTIYDDAGDRAVELYFDAADDKVKLRIGAATIASSVQTYTAGQDLAIALRFSTADGMGLSIRTPAGDVEHIVNTAAIDPGTTGRYYQWAYLTNPSDWGDGSWGDGVWGGTSTFANGVIDNEMIFDRFLSSAEVALLMASTTAVGGLAALRAAGVPEGALVWYAPFDARPIPGFSPLTNGLTYEATVAGGATRSPDAAGLTKGLAYVNAGGSGGIGAFLATTEDEDDLADHQAQFAAEYGQSVRIR
jgi:hypothetical protein